MKNNLPVYIMFVLMMTLLESCHQRKKADQTVNAVTQPVEDTLSARCRLDFKSAKTLSKHMIENEFAFTWVNAKASVVSLIEEKEEEFDIRLSVRKDSAILVSIQYVLGLQVAKILITKDSVKFVDYIHKTYFKGDFNYLSELLSADLDFDLVQAVLFGNSADFQDEESKLKPVIDRLNCKYLLSTERKRKLKRIQTGDVEPAQALQTLTLKAENYKIEQNEFIDPSTNRKFIATYSSFTQKDSVYAPYHVDIDIVAQKKASIKIDYVRIEKNSPQRLSLSIPAKYDPIQIQKK